MQAYCDVNTFKNCTQLFMQEKKKQKKKQPSLYKNCAKNTTVEKN